MTLARRLNAGSTQ